jgi:hypothetical protein
LLELGWLPGSAAIGFEVLLNYSTRNQLRRPV